VAVEHPRDGVRLEEALPADRVRREHLARERLELAAQPRRRRDREAALAPAHDLARHERLDRLAQQPLLLEPAHAHPPR
jgi:hypothetical protein